jgi:hypothetical protein
VHDEQAFRFEHVRDRREVAHRVVRHLREERDVHRVRSEAAHRQRVAIRWRFRHCIRADVPARAGAVFDHDRLAPGFGDPRSDQPRIQVGDAAGRERHDDFDRLRRIGLRDRGRDSDA